MTQVNLTGEEINVILSHKRTELTELARENALAVIQARKDSYESGLNEGLQRGQTVTESRMRELFQYLRNNQKINAIKLVRELTHLDLKSAKDLVESVTPKYEEKSVRVDVFYNGTDYEVNVCEYVGLFGTGKCLLSQRHPGKKAADIAAKSARDVYRGMGYTVHGMF